MGVRVLGRSGGTRERRFTMTDGCSESYSTLGDSKPVCEAGEGPIDAGAAERVMAGTLFEPVRDQERHQGLTIGYTSFGTLEQVQATAERIRRMLSVELHQEVKIIDGPYDVD